MKSDRELLERTMQVVGRSGLDYEQLATATGMSREWARQLIEGLRPEKLTRPTRRKLEAFVAGRGAVVREAPMRYEGNFDAASYAAGQFDTVEQMAEKLADVARSAKIRLGSMTPAGALSLRQAAERKRRKGK